ncbi:MAG: hypothetical protein L0241_05065, partial [Planctomycetia bacterium]|nr:hypothetical protein [Planctomycetia bacterium]
MNRTAGLMVLSVAIGAAVMYGSSNFRLRVEPVNPPPVPPLPLQLPQTAEPGRLPESVTSLAPTRDPRLDHQVRPAGALLQADPTISGGIEKVTEEVTAAETKTPITWNPPTLGNPTIFLITRQPTLVLRDIKDADVNLLRVIPTKPTTPKVIDIKSPTVAKSETTINFNNVNLRDVSGEVLIEVIKVEKVGEKGKEEEKEKRLAAITLRVPVGNVAQEPLIVTEALNSPFLETPTRTPFGKTRITLYNQNGVFLQVKGQLLQSSPTIKFVVHADGKAITEIGATPVDPPVPSPGWGYRLTGLPVYTPGTTGFVATRAEFGGEHFYAISHVGFTAADVVTPLKAPTITSIGKTPAKAADAATPLTKLKDASGRETSVFGSNTRKLDVKITPPPGAQAVLVFVDNARILTQIITTAETAFTTTLELPVALTNVIRVVAIRGAAESEPAIAEVKVRTDGPFVENVSAPGFGQSGGVGYEKIQLRFNLDNPLEEKSARNTANYRVIHNESDAKRNVLTSIETFDIATNTVILTVEKILPGSYTVMVLNAGQGGTLPAGSTAAPGLTDVYGNPPVKTLGEGTVAAYQTVLFTQQVDQPLPSQTVGVTLQTGKAIAFPEYVKFRVSPDGFNPADRVETRVVRLYYFRDAHRVAQIVNRTVKSYNAASVDVRRRAADRGRDDADKATDERKRLELVAVRAAQDARAAENDLAALQQRVASARAQIPQARESLGQLQARLLPIQNDPNRALEVAQLRSDIATTQQALNTLDTIDRQAPADIQRAQNEVAVKREAEARALEAWQVKELQERRLRENQFRVEVAAAKTDPDTYAPADIESNDPVMQVSISVIGEGLIQLRGPIKGLNVIRTMVNQIDSPVGQVRVAVHTLQVNGERGDRMEKVIANIQRYLDHSRFLTVQSGQMLKRAVTLVASRKAYEVMTTLAPGSTQWDRDQRYLYAFFGKDFTDELIQLDSEFLKTGNKLLSLNSMDSTSLSAALFLMALAKNDVRYEIINEFLRLVQQELPQAEWSYYMAGISDPKCCEACKDKKHYLLSYNSKFQSLIGFFTSETPIPDTLTPLQREFIRLAQIFKARMV